MVPQSLTHVPALGSLYPVGQYIHLPLSRNNYVGHVCAHSLLTSSYRVYGDVHVSTHVLLLGIKYLLLRHESHEVGEPEHDAQCEATSQSIQLSTFKYVVDGH